MTTDPFTSAHAKTELFNPALEKLDAVIAMIAENYDVDAETARGFVTMAYGLPDEDLREIAQVERRAGRAAAHAYAQEKYGSVEELTDVLVETLVELRPGIKTSMMMTTEEVTAYTARPVARSLAESIWKAWSSG